MTWLPAVIAGIATYAALRPTPGADIPAWRWRQLTKHEESAVDALASMAEPAAGSGAAATPTRAVGSGDELASCCELLSVAVTSGCTAAEAIEEVAGTASAGPALVEASEHLRRGRTLAEVLEDLAQGSGGWHSMATLMAMSASSGSDASEPLRRLAAAERTRMRRTREAVARRLPVLLLLPLTALVLPAFALVTVVPFVLAGAESFDLPPVVEPLEPLAEVGGN